MNNRQNYRPSKHEILSIIGFVVIGAIAFVGVFVGVWTWTDVSSQVLPILLAAAVALLVWGFRRRIESVFKSRDTENQLPKLSIEYEQINGQFIRSIREIETGISQRRFMVLVKNNGSGDAKECKASLTLRKLGTQENDIPKTFKYLVWEEEPPKPPASEKTIRAKDTEYLLIIFSDSRIKGRTMACKFDALYTEGDAKWLQKEQSELEKQSIEEGDYIAELEVKGLNLANATKKFRIHVDENYVETWMEELDNVNMEIVGTCVIPPRFGMNTQIKYSASFPAEGWICISVANNGSVSFNGCTATIKTDVKDCELYDWEEYDRHRLLGEETGHGAEPYRTFSLASNSTKNLYGYVKTQSPSVTASLKFGKYTIKKKLKLGG